MTCHMICCICHYTSYDIHTLLYLDHPPDSLVTHFPLPQSPPPLHYQTQEMEQPMMNNVPIINISRLQSIIKVGVAYLHPFF